MRHRPASAIALLAILLAFIGPLHAQSTAGPPATRVIVKLKATSPALTKAAREGADAEQGFAQELSARIGVPLVAGRMISSRTQLVRAPDLSAAELAQRLAQEPDVEYAVPDRRNRILGAPNDPLYAAGVGGTGPAAGQWYLRAPAADVPASIDVEPAWAITRGDASVVVAVLDTGVRFDHPDLGSFITQGGNILPGYDMVSEPAIANDGDGRDPDASDPGDWITSTEANDKLGWFYACTSRDPATGKYVGEASSWHGTMTASLIGALTDNGIGMASVSPGVRVLPVRVLGKCGGDESDIADAIRWAAGLSVPGVPPNIYPAKVINLSLGAQGPCGAHYQAAVDDAVNAGAVVVVAAGNTAGHAMNAPANCRGVIGVAGLRHAGTKVGFSDLGPDVTISAPAGNCVNTAAGTPCLYPILAATDLGITSATQSTFTDSYDISVGTSFSSPLVAGVAALMITASPSLSPWSVRQLLQATARPFPTTGGDNGDGTIVPQCKAPQYDSANRALDQVQCYCTTTTCGAGMLDAGAAVAAAKSKRALSPIQTQGLWWSAPAGDENGWGINFAHQGDTIFATWFTYDAAGKPWWLSVTAERIADNVYSGTFYQTHGPAFSAVPFDGTQVTRTAIGIATLAFSGPSTGTFAYTVNGTTQAKAITREVYGALPTCTFGQGNAAAATNYQDLWWSANAEPGWGLNITQQSDVIFATWFTYDANGNATWLSGTATRTAPGNYTGVLVRTTGPSFDATPYRPSKVVVSSAGPFTLSFTDGANGTFGYTVNGVTQTKGITRQLFRAPGTVCQ